MFKIIESEHWSNHKPGGHDFHESQIDSLLNLLKIYQKFNFPLRDRRKASFIIAEDEERGVYGGAVLYPQKISLTNTHEDDIEKIISVFQPKRKEFWAVRFCLYIEQKWLSLNLDTLNFHQNFYETLLKLFTAYGKQEDLGFLALTLNPKDYFNTKTYGWPYKAQIKPKEASDRLFHGLLTTTDENNKTTDTRQFQSLQKHVLANVQGQTDRQVL